MVKNRVLCVAVVAAMGVAVLGAAPAYGKKPLPYKGIGKPAPNSSGQVCFISSWAGNGAWDVSFTSPNGHAYDHFSYSWEEGTSNSSQGACGFEVLGGLLGIPYTVDASGFTWNSGDARLQATWDEQQHPVNEPTVNNKCTDAKTESVAAVGGLAGDYSVTKQGSSFVFTVTLAVPSNLTCHVSLFAVQETGTLTASSAPVPASEFEKSAEVVVTVSDDPSDQPKCDGCSGSWQGELTFKRYHG